MKRLFLTTLLLAAFTLLYSQNEKEKVWQLIVRFDNLVIAKDSVDLNSMMTDDFVGAILTGQYFSKAAYISHHCVRSVGYMALTGQDINSAYIRIYGNTAIINRRVHALLKFPDGNASEFDVQKLEVCIRQNGNWLIASGQGTVVNPNPIPAK
jgi:ketosteroid isomerase-like protein